MYFAKEFFIGERNGKKIGAMLNTVHTSVQKKIKVEINNSELREQVKWGDALNLAKIKVEWLNSFAN